MTDITINPAPAYPVLDAQDRDEDLDNYQAADSSRVQQLAAENTELRETYQQVTGEVARLRDAIEAQADIITELEEAAKDRELFIEQLYGVADVLIHGRRRR